MNKNNNNVCERIQVSSSSAAELYCDAHADFHDEALKSISIIIKCVLNGASDISLHAHGPITIPQVDNQHYLISAGDVITRISDEVLLVKRSVDSHTHANYYSLCTAELHDSQLYKLLIDITDIALQIVHDRALERA